MANLKLIFIVLPFCFLINSLQAATNSLPILKVAIADSRFCTQSLAWPKIFPLPKTPFKDQKKDLDCKNLAPTSQFHGHYFLKSVLHHTQWKNKDTKVQFYLLDLFDMNGNQNLETHLQLLKFLSSEQIPIVIMAAGFDTSTITAPLNKNAFKNLEETTRELFTDQGSKSLWILASGHTDLRIPKEQKESYVQGLWPQSSQVLQKNKAKKIITSWRPLKFKTLNGTTGQGHIGTTTCNRNFIQGHLDTAMISQNPIDLAVSVEDQNWSQAPRPNYPTGSSYATAVVAGKFLSFIGHYLSTPPLPQTASNDAKLQAPQGTNVPTFRNDFQAIWKAWLEGRSIQLCILDQSSGQSNFYSTLK